MANHLDNSSPRAFNTHFWPPRAPGKHVVCRQTCRQNKHRKQFFFNYEKKNGCPKIHKPTSWPGLQEQSFWLLTALLLQWPIRDSFFGEIVVHKPCALQHKCLSTKSDPHNLAGRYSDPSTFRLLLPHCYFIHLFTLQSGVSICSAWLVTGTGNASMSKTSSSPWGVLSVPFLVQFLLIISVSSDSLQWWMFSKCVTSGLQSSRPPRAT